MAKPAKKNWYPYQPMKNRIVYVSGVPDVTVSLVCSAQPVPVRRAHGHAGARALRLGHQGAEPRAGGPGGRQADHRGRGQAGRGKELSAELHRSELGGVAAHGVPAAGPAPSSLADAPAPPAGPAAVQPHLQPSETIALYEAAACSRLTVFV